MGNWGQFQVRRTSQACCGMEKDATYTAVFHGDGGYYLNILVDGEWIGSHWRENNFEILDGPVHFNAPKGGDRGE
jgi:hypothetical protein